MEHRLSERKKELLFSTEVFLRFLHDLPDLMQYCMLWWIAKWPQVFGISISMSLWNVTLRILPSRCGVYSLALESGPGHVTQLNQWMSVHMMQQRLERCWFMESEPLAAFRNESPREEIWSRKCGVETKCSPKTNQPVDFQAHQWGYPRPTSF